MERIAIAIQDGGAGASASMAARAARPTSFLSCRRTSIMGPPVGGTFWFQIFILAPSLEICRKTISGGEGVAGAVNGVACFWATSLEKIFRQPRGRVNGQSRHGRIWQFMRQNMNSPASADYRTLSLPPRKPVGPWGQVLNCSEI